ncbi:MAG: YbhB/YbcL family Raf kinase inhibitor-like protein [Terriglobales bacterium]
MSLLLALLLSFGAGAAPGGHPGGRGPQRGCAARPAYARVGWGALGPDPTLRLASASFRNLQRIPVAHTCDGTARTSAELHWSGAPQGTRSLALIMFDPDARPPRGFVHWVVYDIPARVHAIPSGQYSAAELPGGGVEGDNGRGQLGFVPSCPGPGKPHHYTFTLYALSVPSLGLAAGATREQVLAAMQGKVLAETKLVGLYNRATQ